MLCPENKQHNTVQLFLGMEGQASVALLDRFLYFIFGRSERLNIKEKVV